MRDVRGGPAPSGTAGKALSQQQPSTASNGPPVPGQGLLPPEQRAPFLERGSLNSRGHIAQRCAAYLRPAGAELLGASIRSEAGERER